MKVVIYLSIKISFLVENTVGVPIGLVAEWGLAALIDFDDERILFDVGEQDRRAARFP